MWRPFVKTDKDSLNGVELVNDVDHFFGGGIAEWEAGRVPGEAVVLGALGIPGHGHF
jgi:hypothetical protein